MDWNSLWTQACQFLATSALPAAVILAVGVLVIRTALQLVKKLLERSRLEKAAHKLIRAALRVMLYGLLVIIVASRLGIDVTGVVALASVLTLAVSLSIQNALTNVISGFTLLYTKPFTTGDFVEIAGQSGTVKEIGLTYTKLATGDNKSVFIPNGAVTAEQIVNNTALGARRVEVTVSASYDSPVDTVLEALRRAAGVETALQTPAPFAAVKSYGDSAIVYLLHVWTTAEDYWTTQFAVNKRVKEAFDEAGVRMTYPHVNVHVKNG